MEITPRSSIFWFLSIFYVMLSAPPQSALAQRTEADFSHVVRRAVDERQPSADLGNGYYKNPVISGNYPDPSIVRVGRDYYIVQSGGQARGLPIWQSRDLVNWRPLTRVNPGLPDGDINAPELVHYKDLYYLYFQVVEPKRGHGAGIYVLTARSLQGPWSKPVDLRTEGEGDPGHVVDEQGNR